MVFRKEMIKKLLKKVGEKNLVHGVKDQLQKSIPDSKVVMNLAKRSLYTGRHIQFGNRISEEGGNKSRSWKPNVQEKRLFSYILDRHIRVKVTTHALRPHFCFGYSIKGNLFWMNNLVAKLYIFWYFWN